MQVFFASALSDLTTSPSALFKVGSLSLLLVSGPLNSPSGDVTAAAQLSASTQGSGDLDASSLFYTVNVFPFLRFRLQNQSNIFSLSVLGSCSALNSRIPSNLTGLLAGHYIFKLLPCTDDVF